MKRNLNAATYDILLFREALSLGVKAFGWLSNKTVNMQILWKDVGYYANIWAVIVVLNLNFATLLYLI